MSPLALALRAEAAAHDAMATAKRAQADALESTSSGSELLTRRTWPADAPCTWRVVHDAGLRGELPIVRAGRTPAVRRADVEAWIASRPVAPKLVAVASEDDAPDYVRERGERAARTA